MSLTDPTDEFDSDDPYDFDGDDDDSLELVPCPHCGEDIYEESEQCPYCGDYIVVGTSPFAGRPLWWIVLGVLGLVATVAILMAL